MVDVLWCSVNVAYLVWLTISVCTIEHWKICKLRIRKEAEDSEVELGKTKIILTVTGLLMEGVSERSRARVQ
jgi:hypothetical protein